MHEPVAIIGMSCRFAGAPSVAAFWELLLAGREGVADYEPGRTAELDAFYGAAGSEFGAPTRRGGFIDDIKMFDAEFFGISAREATLLDPQQRLLLELGWEALENAGQVLETISGPRTGVFVGATVSEYGRQLDSTLAVADLFAELGNGLSGMSGRLAYTFDFRGPEVTINSGCASSLAAIHHAMAALRGGRCDVALVGGVNAVIRTEVTQAFARGGALSADGRCKFGDARADGFVRGEGCGMLVLKRLDQALVDDDRIRAVIRGSAVGSFGASSGFLTRPSETGQIDVIAAALADAKVSAAAIDYVEAHGTGTAVGDRAELAALSTAVGRHPGRRDPCWIGSAKSAIGHTEAAAGVAGVIKTVLALEQRYLPATLHVEQPNPEIDWPTAGIVLNAEGRPWSGAGPRRAGVSAFGMTGSSAHVIVEEAPGPVAKFCPPPRKFWLLPLSARSPEALKAMAADYADILEQRSDLADIAFTAARRRSTHPYRLAVTGRNGDELVARLRTWSELGAAALSHAGWVGEARDLDQRAKSVMVFPGQGSQWVGMGRELLATEATFREAFARCDAAVQAETGWSVDRLLADHAALESADIAEIQPVLFSIQVSLAALWASWGVTPSVLVGHSMGEIAVAHVAGALSLEDAVAVICRRSALMRRFTGRGAMALVELSADEAESELRGYQDRLAVAVSNGPRATVLAGQPAALHSVVQSLQARGVFCRPVAVQVAAHSPQMDEIRDELLDALQGIRPLAGSVPIFSTTLGKFTDGAEFDARYWVDNLRRPVLFHAAVQALLEVGKRTFIEVSPHPILLPSIEETADALGVDALGLPSLRRAESDQATMLTACGQLFATGAPIDWRGIYPGGRVVDVPAYPWRRREFWPQPSANGKISLAAGGHPLLPPPFKTAERCWIWVCTLNTDTLPWLKDHAVRGVTLLPASAYVEMAAAAGRQLAGADNTGTQVDGAEISVERLRFKEAVVFTPPEDQIVQIIAKPERVGRWSLEFHVRETPGDRWTVAASCRIVASEACVAADLPAAALSAFASGAPDGAIPGSRHAARLKELGYDFGPGFLNLRWIDIEGMAVRAEAELGRDVRATAYGLHPALLDAAFQSLAAGFLHPGPSGRQLIPQSIGRARILPAAVGAQRALIVARLHGHDGFSGNVRLFAPDGAMIAEVGDLRFQMFERDTCEAGIYDIDWTPAEPDATPQDGPSAWLVLADQRGVGASLVQAMRDRSVRVELLTELEVENAFGIHDGTLELRLTDAADIGSAGIGVIHCATLDLPGDAAVERVARHVADIAALATVLERVGVSPLFLVTQGACAVEVCSAGATPAGQPRERVSASQAAVWGLGASIANELPSLACRLVDLAAAAGRRDAAADLVAELFAGPEPRVALRSGRRHVARLQRRREGLTRALRDDERAELVLSTPGVLDSLATARTLRRAPGSGEIEIEIHAVGLNFLDVLRAMRLVDPTAHLSPTLGEDCAGLVVRVGAGVTEFKVGDRVVAFSPNFQTVGTLASHLVTDAVLAAKAPDTLSMAEAAALPCVYVTSYFALVEAARVRAGESVLIHSATGGVGLSAIEVARWLGAKIIGSAGTEAKRELLRSMGIEGVFDSRKLPFAAIVADLTGGRGVDVIINSLTGAAIAEGLAALAPYGRFLEIGKRDMWDNSPIGMGSLLQNRSVFGVDLATMTSDDRERVGALLRKVMDMVRDGVFAPLPVTVFPASRAAEGFHLMAAAGHIGKVVIETTAMQVPATGADGALRPDGAHLISGGFGALGLIAAEALVAEGARNLVLCGRAAPTPQAMSRIAELRAKGATVLTRVLDIGDADAVRSLLDEITRTLPPLRGVVHSAGVLSDALLSQITAQDAGKVMHGKVGGARLLDQLTAGLDLDYFLLFSSATALLGSAGQGSYAASNAMLDAIARDRAARSLPALSVGWGPWAEIGLAAAQANRGARMAERGLPLLSPAEGRAVIRRLLHSAGPYAAVMRFEPVSWIDASATSAGRLFDDLSRNPRSDVSADATPSRGIGLSADDPISVLKVIESQLAAVLRQPVDATVTDRTFRSLGVDSLMGLELRNRLERSLGLKLSASAVWNFPTPRQLCSHLVSRLAPPAPADVKLADALQAWEPEQMAARALEDELDEAAAALAEL